MFGLLTGSQVARFALPAPEPPEGTTPPAPAPSMEPAPSAQLEEQNHSLQPVSSEVNPTAARGPVQTAQQPLASEAPMKQAQPRKQLPGSVPSPGQSATAPKGAAQAKHASADMSEAPRAAELAGSAAVTASFKPVAAKPADAKALQAASAKSAEEVEPAGQPTGPPQQQHGAAASFSYPSMGQPNEVNIREQASNAGDLQPDVPQAPSELDDSRQKSPPQSAEGLKGKPQASAQGIAHIKVEQPASAPEPAVDEVEVLWDDSASAQPAPGAAAEGQLPAQSTSAQDNESALQSELDSVHAAAPPHGEDDSMASVVTHDTPPTADIADEEQGTSAAGQADSAHPAATEGMQQKQPVADATPSGVQAEAESPAEAAHDSKAGSVRVAAENGDSGHSMAVSAPREAEPVQHGESSGSKPEPLASAAPALPTLSTMPVQDISSQESPVGAGDSLAIPKQETGSQEGMALTHSSAPQKGIPAPAPQMAPSEAGSAEHGKTAVAQMHEPAVEPSAPSVSHSSGGVLDDRGSAKPPPKHADSAVQPPGGRVSREQDAMGAATSSGIESRAAPANVPTQGHSESASSTMSKTGPPAGSSMSRSSTTALTAKQASQDSASSSVSKAAADPLQALLGETQPRLARPPPRLTRPLSSGPSARQSTSSGAAAGKGRSTCPAHSPACQSPSQCVYTINMSGWEGIYRREHQGLSG